MSARPDQPDWPVSSDRWLTTAQATALLGITPAGVNALARRGKLARTIERGCARFPLADIERLAASRERRTHDITESTQWWGDRAANPEIQPGDELIGTRDAAAILGITPLAVTNLVRRGLLPAHQKRPGKQGSPLLLSHNAVVALLNQPGYQQRRAAFDKRKTGDGESWTKGREEEGLEPVRRRGDTVTSRKDRGQWLSTRQVALQLGVCPARVHKLRRTGRLKGVQHKPRRKGTYYRPEVCTGNRR